MLRVGLTGGLGSGKSTAAAILRELGAHVLDADTVGRELMQPGQPVFQQIVESFGQQVLRPDGALDRTRLATLAFEGGELAELNRIVHPPVIAAQESWMNALFARDPEAVAIIESALIFEAGRNASLGGTVPGWRERFDCVVVVTAPEPLKIARYRVRIGKTLDEIAPQQRADRIRQAEQDARRRLAAQIPDDEKIPLADYVVRNDASMDRLRDQVAALWSELVARSRVQRAVNGPVPQRDSRY